MPSLLPIVGILAGLLVWTLLGLGSPRRRPGIVVLARLGRRVALPPEALLPLSCAACFPPVLIAYALRTQCRGQPFEARREVAGSLGPSLRCLHHHIDLVTESF
jgi:hypothetical protein